MDRETYLQHVAQTDPTPCNGCTACCRGNQAVEIRPDQGDNPAHYPHKAIENCAGVMKLVLARKPNGDCIHLGAKGCAIHDTRPATCRAFDCRRQFAFTPKAVRREMIARGVFSREIMDAGKKRQDSLKLMEGEEKLGRFMAEFIINRARHGETEGRRIMQQKLRKERSHG